MRAALFRVFLFKCYQFADNRPNTDMYSLRLQTLPDFRIIPLTCYNGKVRDCPTRSLCQYCVWQVSLFLFSSVDYDSVHTIVFVCLRRLSILLYYKLQHFVSLCPILQVRWIVKVIKERERKDSETKIMIIWIMATGYRRMYICKRYFRLGKTST